jgi:hypothetical protein
LGLDKVLNIKNSVLIGFAGMKSQLENFENLLWGCIIVIVSAIVCPIAQVMGRDIGVIVFFRFSIGFQQKVSPFIHCLTDESTTRTSLRNSVSCKQQIFYFIILWNLFDFSSNTTAKAFKICGLSLISHLQNESRTLKIL